MNDAEEDLIEPDEPSPTLSKLRQRLDVLVPPRVGRRFLGVVTVTALALGLVAGYLVGQSPGDGVGADASHDLNNIPFVPEGELNQERVIVFTVGSSLLTPEDLTALGEQPVPSVTPPASGLAGVCAADDTQGLPTGPDPLPETGSIGAVTFELTDASLSELISPDLDVLASSTLSAEVELARNCANSGNLTVETEGVLRGVGDEYAPFTVRRTDPASGEVTTSYVVLVRVGGQLIEVSLTTDPGLYTHDGLTRALRIAEAAAARLLGG
ncbi:MAG: hypothetical protein M3400_01500 [Actinomycetota bacterium]|nr:hypothetical protein [Actinomycetota bacterium]